MSIAGDTWSYGVTVLGLKTSKGTSGQLTYTSRHMSIAGDTWREKATKAALFIDGT